MIVVLIVLKRMGKLPAWCSINLRWPFSARVNLTYNQNTNNTTMENVVILGDPPIVVVDPYKREKNPRNTSRRSMGGACGDSRKGLPKSVISKNIEICVLLFFKEPTTTYANVYERPTNRYATAPEFEAPTNSQFGAGPSNV